MNTNAHSTSELDVNFSARILRATIGVGLATPFLTGVWVTPAWILTASVLAIYLVISAILGKGLLDIVFRSAAREAVQPAYGGARTNVGRLARGATASVAMGSVLGDAVIDAYALEAIDIFMLNVGGVLLAMTTLFGAKPAFTETPAPVMVDSISGTGQVTEPEFASKKHAA